MDRLNAALAGVAVGVVVGASAFAVAQWIGRSFAPLVPPPSSPDACKTPPAATSSSPDPLKVRELGVARQRLRADLPPPPPPPLGRPARRAAQVEQLSRNRQFFGDAGQGRVEGAFVVVIGAGGVGSHCAHMLLRAGVRKLRLVDFDNVSLSSLNRHATAVRADVGTPKVAAMARTFAAIAPWCEVEAVQEVFTAGAADRLLAGSPDFVCDCIDDTATKTALLVHCCRAGLRVVTSLSAGGRADPTCVRISDLRYVRGDPLLQAMRSLLREQRLTRATASGAAGVPEAKVADADVASLLTPPLTDAGGATVGLGGDGRGVVTVYSVEAPRASLLPLEMGTGDKPADFGAMAGFRVSATGARGRGARCPGFWSRVRGRTPGFACRSA
jgi:tRNA A37 threonylcarbamoyladenosine dehydratase